MYDELLITNTNDTIIMTILQKSIVYFLPLVFDVEMLPITDCSALLTKTSDTFLLIFIDSAVWFYSRNCWDN